MLIKGWVMELSGKASAAATSLPVQPACRVIIIEGECTSHLELMIHARFLEARRNSINEGGGGLLCQALLSMWFARPHAPERPGSCSRLPVVYVPVAPQDGTSRLWLCRAEAARSIKSKGALREEHQ